MWQSVDLAAGNAWLLAKPALLVTTSSCKARAVMAWPRLCISPAGRSAQLSLNTPGLQQSIAAGSPCLTPQLTPEPS